MTVSCPVNAHEAVPNADSPSSANSRSEHPPETNRRMSRGKNENRKANLSGNGGLADITKWLSRMTLHLECRHVLQAWSGLRVPPSDKYCVSDGIFKLKIVNISGLRRQAPGPLSEKKQAVLESGRALPIRQKYGTLLADTSGMNRRVLSVYWCFSLLFPISSLALDFDGDGLDDPVAYENQHDGSANELAYTYQKSSTGETVRYEFGSATEFPALADYDGDGITDFAAVGAYYDSNPSGDLLWRMRLSSQNGQGNEVVFGAVGDTYISGCSFDGDALADQAFVSAGVFHVLKSSDSSEAAIDLGETRLKRFTCGDINGDGIADLIAQGALQREGTKAKSYFLAWSVPTAEKILDVKFGSGVKSIHAVDIDGDGIKEVAYRKDSHGYGRKLIVRLNETPVTFALPRFQAVDFGHFVSGSAAQGIFLKIPADDQFLVFPGLSDLFARTEIELPDTVTAVPSVNSTEVGPSRSVEAGCDVHDEPNDGPDGFLYKPVSETQRNVVILTHRSSKFRRMQLVKDGVVLEKVPRVTYGPGTRDFFRSRRLASTFPTYMTIKMQSPDGLVHCILIPDPTVRYD